MRLLAGANSLHAAKSLVEESRIFGLGLYNENKKALLTQVDTVSEEKGRTMKTQLGEETNVANLMSSLEAAGRLIRRDRVGRRSGETRRRRHRCRETKADAACQRQMNQAVHGKTTNLRVRELCSFLTQSSLSFGVSVLNYR